jgi:hypothetical protein
LTPWRVLNKLIKRYNKINHLKIQEMAAHQDKLSLDAGTPLDDDGRKFLAYCGKFAVVTPRAITMLLSTSLNSTTIAHSGGSGSDGPGGGGGPRGPGGRH